MIDSTEILKGLNPQQHEAVITTQGPLLVLAGAGSGKTSVLTRRIAWILENNLAERSQILAVTFTNKAAREMTERIEQWCGPGYFNNVGTFHSVCAKWLRKEAAVLGISSNFTIYDSTAQLSVMKATIKELNLDDTKYPPRAILSQVSKCKNYSIPLEQYQFSSNIFQQIIAKAGLLYNKKLHGNDALDFDDILTFSLKLFKENPEVLERYGNWLKYVLVDEFQDVNPVQAELLDILAKKHQNLCVVGDDDQSIYGFRGADISIILAFEKKYPTAKVIKLEQNYRSTPNVLNVANVLVTNNNDRMSKKLWSSKENGPKPIFYQASSAREEALFAAKQIMNMPKATERTDGYKYSDIAILYRTNAQSRIFEEIFLQHNIAHAIIGGQRFYERKEIKDLLAYLKLLINPLDSISTGRVIGLLPGVGETSIKKLITHAACNGVSLFDTMSLASKIGIVPRIATKIENLFKWLKTLGSEITRKPVPVYQVVCEIIEKSDYYEILQNGQSKEEIESRRENIQELLNVVKEFDNTHPSSDNPSAEFLNEVSLLSDQDTIEDQAPRVNMMTIHTSKGLEFKVVFLVGLEEDTLPHMRATQGEPQDVEEERRLCYVGITRAKERLYMTCAENRTFYDKKIPKQVSRFATEIPTNLLDFSLNYSQARILRNWKSRQNLSGQSAKTNYYSDAGDYSNYQSKDYQSRSSASYSRNTATRSTSAKSNIKSYDSNLSATSSQPPSPLLHSSKTKSSAPSPRDLARAEMEKKFPIGSHINHRVFGRGKVVKVERGFVTAVFASGAMRSISDKFIEPCP